MIRQQPLLFLCAIASLPLFQHVFILHFPPSSHECPYDEEQYEVAYDIVSICALLTDAMKLMRMTNLKTETDSEDEESNRCGESREEGIEWELTSAQKIKELDDTAQHGKHEEIINELDRVWRGCLIGRVEVTGDVQCTSTSQ